MEEDTKPANSPAAQELSLSFYPSSIPETRGNCILRRSPTGYSIFVAVVVGTMQFAPTIHTHYAILNKFCVYLHTIDTREHNK